MALDLILEVSENCDCTQATVCDSTCQPTPYNNIYCCDGYGVDGNASREDIGSTRFDFKLPDGTEFLDVDLGWIPGTRAKAEIQITAGTTGAILLAIEGVVIGQGFNFNDLALTIEALIQNINVLSADTGWQAFLKEGSTDIIVIESINMGLEYNDKEVDIYLDGDMTAVYVVNPTAGANGNTDCVTYTMDDVYGLPNDLTTNEFPDGVHEVTYIIYDSLGAEIRRITNSILFTCSIRSIIRKLILLPANDTCACSAKFDDRLVELRLMLEKAEVQMADCLYDCANETIRRAHKFAEGICSDC